MDQINHLYGECDIICCTETWLSPKLSDHLIYLDGKKVYRQDRIGNDVRSRGGGICVYVTDKLSPYCNVRDLSKCTSDFEILLLDILKPGLKYMSIICVYRPPNGKLKPCIDYLKNVIMNCRSEIWIIGDINVDFLDRANVQRTKFQTLFTTFGLKQLIHGITRPSKKSGTCIDWIVTNSIYIKKCGVTNDYISDHCTIYCIRKKSREVHNYVYRTVRDLSKFDENVFSNLLQQSNWDPLRESDDMEFVWDTLYTTIYDILTVMCPFRKYRQREHITPWLTAEIYKAMRERDTFMKLFKQTGHEGYLSMARRYRNHVNGMIRKAKSNYIQRQLNINEKNSKKFWRVK